MLQSVNLALRDCPHVEAPSLCNHCSARRLSVCGSLADEALARLAVLAEPIEAEPDAVLVREGDQASHLINVTSGVVRVSKLLSDGRRQIVGFLFAGDFLGLAAGERYPFSAEAVDEVTACRFRRPAYQALLKDTPALEGALLARASDDLRAAQEHMLLLGRKTALERVASFLLDVSTRTERAVGDGVLIPLPMTRSEIADYLGLTIETVSRTVSRLKLRGVISLPSQRSALIEQPDVLRALSGSGED